jgi:hypothetical protein
METTEEDDFVQSISSGDEAQEELEHKMELSYKQRLEDVARSRPESNSSFLGSSCGGPRSAVQRLRSA